MSAPCREERDNYRQACHHRRTKPHGLKPNTARGAWRTMLIAARRIAHEHAQPEKHHANCRRHGQQRQRPVHPGTGSCAARIARRLWTRSRCRLCGRVLIAAGRWHTFHLSHLTMPYTYPRGRASNEVSERSQRAREGRHILVHIIFNAASPSSASMWATASVGTTTSKWRM
jgi:hypothetical protein